MANFTKAFNFRGGFQVDNDVLVVRGQRVGIGSTTPQEVLDVNGIVKARGLDINSIEPVAIQSATVGFLTAGLIHVGVTSISNGIITATSTAGVVTYYGDGGRLLNLPTSQWLDIDVGLGFTSIYAQGYVGVDTTDPRYVFQVGGVPFAPKAGFLTSQTGVGIEDGNIFASGDINAGGDFNITGEVDIIGSVSVGETVTAGQFVGFGSGIQLLNADNLGVGSIPSNRYGDTIITGTVFGDRFAGVADTALSVAIDADLTFDTATGREIQATERFFTPNGKIQVGSDTVASVGDIDVKKDIGDSTIYSLSTSATSRVFVGRNRETGTNQEYGGLRFGGRVGLDPLSGIHDLDVINYDTGNVNYYLHGGPSPQSTTTGSFRWIYGQTDRILGEISRYGKVTFFGNNDPIITDDVTLDIQGSAQFADRVAVGNGLTVTGNSFFDDSVVILGDLTLGGNIGITTDSLQLPSTQFRGRVLVGNEPTTGGGVALSTTGDIAGNTIEIYNGLTTSFSVTQGGAVDAQGIGCTGINAEILVQSPLIVGGDYSGNNGFLNDNSGAFFNVLTTLDLDSQEFQSTNATIGDITAGVTETDTLIVNGISITGVGSTLFINGDISVGATIFTQPEVTTQVLRVGLGNTVTQLITQDNGGFYGLSLISNNPLTVPKVSTDTIVVSQDREIQITPIINGTGQTNELQVTVSVASTDPQIAGDYVGVIPLTKV